MSMSLTSDLLRSEKSDLSRQKSTRERSWRQALEENIPILYWLPRYPLENLQPDFAGSITLGCILIGQSLAHANLCMVNLINGPYSCMLPPIVYAFFGTCVHASVGTGGLVSLLTGEVLAPLGDLEERTKAAAMLTAMVGMIMALMGVLQLAFLVRFLSRPALSGFITASAMLIMLSQVAPMLGLPDWASKGGIVNIVRHHLTYLEMTSPATLCLSTVTLLFLLNAKRLKTVRFLKFLSDFKELVMLAVSAVFCTFYNQQAKADERIRVVGKVPSGLPNLTFPVTSAADLQLMKELVPGAILLAFVVFLSSFAGAKKFAMKDGYQIRAFNELMALGFANFLGAFFGSVPTQVGLSRMGIAHQAGIKSQLGANVLVGVVVCLGVVLFSRYVENVPMCVLNCIIVNGASHLTEFDQAVELYAYAQNERYSWKMRGEMFTWIIGFSCTLCLGAFQGMLAAVVTSLVIILYQVVNPDIVELGFRERDGEDTHSSRARKWMALDRAGACREHGILVLRMEGPLFYANVERLQEWVEEQELDYSERSGIDNSLDGIILSASAIPFMDTSAVQTLYALIKTCAGRGTLFCIANTFGTTGRIAADKLEPLMLAALKTSYLKTQLKNSASIDDFVKLVRGHREALDMRDERPLRLVRCSTLQAKSCIITKK